MRKIVEKSIAVVYNVVEVFKLKRFAGVFSLFIVFALLFSGCSEGGAKEAFNSLASSDVITSSDNYSSDISSLQSSSEDDSSVETSSVYSSSEDNSSQEIQSSQDISSVESSEEAPPPPQSTVKKECYLTFDDGPTKNTLEILDILEEHNVKATFFVIAQNPDYLQRIVDGGHAIGLHSYSHEYKIYSSSEEYFNDLNKISDYVYNAVGQRPKIIRFAGGSSNTISMNYCRGIMSKLTKQVREKGYNYYDWNVGSGDASGVSVPTDTIVNNVINGVKNKNSVCVLMHDAAGKKTTVDALPKIITELKKQGFEFKVLTPDIQGFKHAVNN